MTAMGTLRLAHPTGCPHTPPTPPVMLTPHVTDDSDQSVFGYSYTPGEQVQEVLDQGSR